MYNPENFSDRTPIRKYSKVALKSAHAKWVHGNEQGFALADLPATGAESTLIITTPKAVLESQLEQFEQNNLGEDL